MPMPQRSKSRNGASAWNGGYNKRLRTCEKIPTPSPTTGRSWRQDIKRTVGVGNLAIAIDRKSNHAVSAFLRRGLEQATTFGTGAHGDTKGAQALFKVTPGLGVGRFGKNFPCQFHRGQRLRQSDLHPIPRRDQPR